MSYDPENTFAGILRGDLPCIKVYEDKSTLAFMDIMPQADGHVLIIPKVLARTIFDLPEESAVACIKVTRRIAIAVRAAFNVQGMVILQVNGTDAGQTVPHVHFHVIPRRLDVPLRPHGVVCEDTEKLNRFAALIMHHLQVAGSKNTSGSSTC
jgi:histidine triad (HIT) family protein